MRQPIETVPKDGKAVILEDPVAGSYELAKWSAEESVWLNENGGRCEIAPIYWHAINRAKQLEDKESSEEVHQINSAVSTSLDVTPVPTVPCLDSPTVPELEHQRARAEDEVPTRGRVATWCGIAMLAASLSCMYFRADVKAYVARHNDQISNTIGATIPRTVSPLPEISFVSDDRPPQTQTADVNVPPQGAQLAAISTPLQRSDAFEGANALENELHATRDALAEAQRSKLRSEQAAQEASTALQQSLEKIALLETKLELARRNVEQAAPPRSRRMSRRGAGRLPQANFFGLFNPPPNQTLHRRSARIR